MLTSSVNIETASLSLKSAILVYSSGSGTQDAIATAHTVEVVDGKPIIQAGRLFTHDDLQALHSGLTDGANKRAVTWVEPTLLAYGGGRTIWYSAPCKRAMFFMTTGSASRKAMTCRGIAPVPGLVWMRARDVLYVYAVRGTKRPDFDTMLCQAPFFNVYESGMVCEGTAIRPPEDAPNVAWENAFFQSRFTHANVHNKDRLVHGEDPYAFWTGMIRKPKAKFPEGRLVDLKISVGDLTETKLSK